jgi:hypothetical protein
MMCWVLGGEDVMMGTKVKTVTSESLQDYCGRIRGQGMVISYVKTAVR